MKTILLIDDNIDLREDIAQILTLWGYTFIGVSSYVKAINELKQQAIDLVISDLVLSDGQGTAILNHIRESHTDKNLPFILLSGHDLEYIYRDGLKYQPDIFLQKPFSLRGLNKAISDILNKEAGV